MTDPSTLFLSSPQLRPSWTINGLTLELNLAPTAGGATAVSEGNNYATQTFQGIHPSNAATGTVFASVVGQGQCSAPLRLAVRGGTSCWTQTAPSEPVATGMPTVVGDSIFAITQSAAFLSTGLSANASGHTLNGTATAAAATAASIPSGNAAAAATFVPSNAVLEQSLCQLQQLMAKGLLNPATPASNAAIASSGAATAVVSAGGAYFVTAGPVATATTAAVANGGLDAKRRELAQTQQQQQHAQSLPGERRKRQKPWKNCGAGGGGGAASVMVAPQPSAGEMTTAVGLTSGATANSYAVYELPPSSCAGAALTGSAEGNLGVASGLHASVAESSLLSPTTTPMSPGDHKSVGAARPFRPIAVKRDGNGTPCQVAEITTSSLNGGKVDQHLTATPVKRDPEPVLSMAPTSAPTSQLAQLSTSTQSTSVATNAIAATGATVMSNGGIPVGIAVARQRFVANSSGKSQTTTGKDVIATSAATSYSSIVPYPQTLIEPSMFASSISNIGVVAGAASCDDRSGTNVGAGLAPPIIAWPTTTGLQSQQQQQWHPYAVTSPAENQIQNMPSACAGYQLARDPVTGQLMLIPANQIDSMPQRTAYIIPGGAQAPSAGYTSCTSQQMQSFLISQPPSQLQLQQQQQQPQQQQKQQQQQQQQQPASHSLILDHLVTLVPSINVNAKQKPVPSAILKLDDGPIAGVMMPCDLGKTSSMNSTNATAAIGQQLISNNSSFSLVQQFNASNIHNPNLNMPHHFSSISSSGSLLIQQISGNSGPPPLLNQVNNSVVIAESAATQSVINSQSQYQPSNTSYLINTQQISSENSTIIDQVQPTPCLMSASATPPSTYAQFPPAAAVPVDDGLQSLKASASTAVVQMGSCALAPVKRVDAETKTTGASLAENEVCQSRATSDEYSVDKSGEEAVIKVDTNSSVQDASNQTDSMISFGDEEEDGEDDDDDDEDGNALRIIEEYEEPPSKDKKEEEVQPEDGGTAEPEVAKVYSDETPDFSGLQLLLNGIERVENCRLTPEAEEDATKGETEGVDAAQPVVAEPVVPQPKQQETEDSSDTEKLAPNSLQILCALADQRFKEEKEVAESDEESFSESELKEQSRKEAPIKREVGHQYRSLESKQETRRFLSSKYTKQSLCSLSPNEAQIRMQLELAKLQKKYRETKKELNRLSHRKYTSSSSATRSPTPCYEQPPASTIASHDSDAAKATTPVKRRPGRPRKYSLEQADGAAAAKAAQQQRPSVKPMKRPKLKLDSSKASQASPLRQQASDDESKVSKLNNGDLSPPVLEPMCASPKAKPFQSDILSPPTLIPSKKSFLGSKGLVHHSEQNVKKAMFRLSSPDDSSDEELEYHRKRMAKSEVSLSSSREPPSTPPKRKVGRPRKYPREEGAEEPASKKPKLGSVGRSSLGGTTVTNKFPKDKRIPSTYNKISEKQVPVTSSVVSTFALLKSQRRSSDYAPEAEVESKPKITPKLKAEAKLKKWHDSPEDNIKDDLDLDYSFVKRKVDPSDSILLYKDRKDLFDKRDKSHSSKVRDYTSGANFSNSARIPSPSSTEYCNEDFRITSSLLESTEKRPLRVLISVGGLFRAGELKAIQPPDLYGIKLDGERGQRTHIYTKEEVLRDVVLEVRGRFPLRSGTRVCAFWSSQYLSLYPGYVTSFSSSDESEDENFTAVSFDDGDSGRIRINDIRLLPKDFSFSRHYDYTSMESDGKRKRRSSTLSYEEIPVDKQLHSPESPSLFRDSDLNGHGTTSPSYDSSSRSSFHNENVAPKIKPIEEKSDDLSNISKEMSSSERKRLKKKRKEKLREQLGGARSSSSSSSCKRKSHKRRSDSDELCNGKSHKRHKHHHKHKHHKHHKKHKSLSDDHDNKKRAVAGPAAGGESANCAAPEASRRPFDGASRAAAAPSSAPPRTTDQPSPVKAPCGVGAAPESPRGLADAAAVAHRADQRAAAETQSKSKWTPATYLSRFADSLKESKLAAVAGAVRLENPKSANPCAIASLLEKSKAIYSEEDDEDSRATGDDDVASVSSDEKPACEKTGEDVDEKEEELDAEPEKSKKSRSNEEKSDTEEADESAASSKLDKSTELNTSEDVPSSKTLDDEDEDAEEDEEDEDREHCAEDRDSKLWDWHGKGVKRNGRGRGRKQFYRSIKRGSVIINVDDCAVFLTENGSSDKPFIGRIESMWESNGMMWVRVNWFYHPEETEGLKKDLPFRGGLFESLHNDKNDIQTISHKCNVVPIEEFRDVIAKEPDRLESIYTRSDLYYLAGHYDVKTKTISFCDNVISS